MSQTNLTIVIPVYNEGDNIEHALREIDKIVTYPYKLLIVYDFDEDNTLPAAIKIKDELNLPLTLLKNTLGRGVLNAIKVGLQTSETPYTIVTMADLSDPPEVINAMMKKAINEDADVVCASRYMKGGKHIGGPFLKGLMSRFAGVSLHYLAGIPVHDITNSFKLYSKKLLGSVKIESDGGFELGMELVIKAHIAGLKLCEVPTIWTDRVAGESNFNLKKWLPKYLKWYFYAIKRRFI